VLQNEPIKIDNKRRIRLAVTTVVVAGVAAFAGTFAPAADAKMQPGDVKVVTRCFEDDSCRATAVTLLGYVNKMGTDEMRPVYKVLSRMSWCKPGGYCETHRKLPLRKEN
jgi:hypothetical protein